MSRIPDFTERCAKHPDHQSGMVTHSMIAERLHEEVDDLRAEIDRLRGLLKYIAANTCCDRCQEAALVAKLALAGAADQPGCPFCGGTKGHWEGCRAPIDPALAGTESQPTAVDPDADARAAFYATGRSRGWAAPEWENLADQTKQTYRDFVARRAADNQSATPTTQHAPGCPRLHGENCECDGVRLA